MSDHLFLGKIDATDRRHTPTLGPSLTDTGHDRRIRAATRVLPRSGGTSLVWETAFKRVGSVGVGPRRGGGIG